MADVDLNNTEDAQLIIRQIKTCELSIGPGTVERQCSSCPGRPCFRKVPYRISFVEQRRRVLCILSRVSLSYHHNHDEPAYGIVHFSSALRCIPRDRGTGLLIITRQAPTLLKLETSCTPMEQLGKPIEKLYIPVRPCVRFETDRLSVISTCTTAVVAADSTWEQ